MKSGRKIPKSTAAVITPVSDTKDMLEIFQINKEPNTS
jgi:hypothetical protein